jgi:hypothetical protein
MFRKPIADRLDLAAKNTKALIMTIRKQLRIKRRESVDFSDRGYLIICLQSGHDFFNELPEDEADRIDLLRQAWADAEIRRAVYAQCRKTKQDRVPWAEKKFGRID